MNYVKSFIVAVMIAAFAIPAQADDFINAVLGAGLGAAAGSKVGNGNGRKAAIAVGALGGAFLGGNADQATERRHREMLHAQGYMTSAERNELERNNRGYVPPQQVAYREPVRQYAQSEYYEQRPVRAVPVSTCDTEYYKGEYNPDLAQAFCRGQMQRERLEYAQLQRERARQADQAYQEGLQGR